MRFTTKLLLGLLLIVLLGQFLPYTFVSVQGDSMDPTIPDGSLQLMEETNNAEVGDIIVFESQQASGQIIIHRIDSVQQDGFVTLGDNNKRTDQETGEPLVQKQDIHGQAVVVAEQPIYIPYMGSLAQFVQTRFFESMLLLLGALALNLMYKQLIANKKQQGILTQNDIVFPIFFAVFLVLTVVILVGASTISAPMTYTSSDAAAQQQYIVHVDDPDPTETITIEIEDKLGVELYTSSYEITNVDSQKDPTEITVIVPPQDTPGAINGYVKVYRFPPILPESWLQYLITISPLIPAVMSSASVLVPLYTIYMVLGDPYQRVAKPRNRVVKRIYEYL